MSLSVALLACAGPQKSTNVRFGDAHSATIAQIDDCDDFGSDPLRLDPERPLIVLIHGCSSSSARLKTVAALFESAGQQVVCFSYDERERLETSSGQLQDSLRILEGRQKNSEFTILAHSMGGLVARHALVNLKLWTLARFRLIAVSAPFAGIDASSHCGSTALHVLSLGVSAGVCQLVTGSKWTEIHPGSGFTSQPGALPGHVIDHLQIVTDEANSCRQRSADGACEEDDFVFSIGEQTNPLVDSDPRVTRIVAKVGHAEVIGLEGRPPTLLMALLRAHALLDPPVEGSTSSRY